ncbi:MAG: ACT domain-containing protein [Clostridium celatum]|nr:ACT domain-containing protein [Clostridium celatum]
MIMGMEKFYIVNEKSLPEIFKKVIEVKEIISLGKSKDVNEAIRTVGISRSTYYKYKDDIFPMAEEMKSKKVTLIVLMSHKSGTLSKVLDCIAFYKGNILTINQDIPINLCANVTVTIDISHMEKSISQLAARLNSLPNVRSVKLLAAE